MSVIAAWKQKANLLTTETFALCLAYKDPRVPWYAKVFVAAIIGYAISPIDLIPDFIPVLGYIDDLIILPAGIFLAIKMIPRGVLEECREKARTGQINSRVKWVMAFIIISVWLLVIILTFRFIWQVLS
ncbi:MAG: YkvA family protein [Chloroflexota bacterium]